MLFGGGEEVERGSAAQREEGQVGELNREGEGEQRSGGKDGHSSAVLQGGSQVLAGGASSGAAGGFAEARGKAVTADGHDLVVDVGQGESGSSNKEGDGNGVETKDGEGEKAGDVTESRVGEKEGADGGILHSIRSSLSSLDSLGSAEFPPVQRRSSASLRGGAGVCVCMWSFALA